MKKKLKSFLQSLLLFVCLLACIPPSVLAQEENKAAAFKPHSTFNLGIGFGLDYGGFGVSLNYIPLRPLVVYGGFGYNLLGLGYNIGAAYRILPEKRFCPSLGAMYGYNAVILVEGEDSPYNKTYYGPSFAASLEWHSRKKSENYFKLALIIPIRPQSYYDDLDKLKNDPAYEVKIEPIPVAFSIGYHLGL